MIKKISHTCIAVNDLERSVAFYRDVLGCKVGPEMDYGSVICQGLYIGDDNEMLELMLLRNPEAENKQFPLKAGEKGNIHICFQVENIDEMAQKVKDAGVEITKDLFEMELGGGNVIHNFYFRDPDGYALQLLQPKTTS